MADLLVLGASFVGMSFAIAAHMEGFDVHLYDKAPKPALANKAGANVIAVNPRSADFLDQIGVWELIPNEFVTPYKQISVFDGEGSGSISLGADEVGSSCLGFIVDQTALRVAMNERAISEGLEIRWGETANTDSDQDQTGLLVAADGVNSETRERLGIKKIGYSYGQRATVCIVEFNSKLGNETSSQAYQWFRDSGPLALLPIGGRNKFAVVWSSSEDMGSKTENEFMSDLEEATERKLGRIARVSKRNSFPLIQQHALQYAVPGAVLLGDAAHSIHPLAGQGANLGFADARCLVTELCAARLEGRSSQDLRVLKRYERKRRTENHLAGVAMEGFHRIFTTNSSSVGVMRSSGLRFFNNNRVLKRLAIHIASGHFW